MKATLNRDQKLKSRKDIAALFVEGANVKSFPLKIVFLTSNENIHKVAFSVPKRSFKHAVDRNRIKRMLRECYRLNQELIVDHPNKLNLMFIFMGKTIPTYQELNTNVVVLLQKLSAVTL